MHRVRRRRDGRHRFFGARPQRRQGRTGALRVYPRGVRERRGEAEDLRDHHHLIPIPGTGRERNIIFDAGDVLELLDDVGVDLVLSGHKHVPYSWKLEDFFIVNAGTASTTRLRGNTRPCYNIIEIENGRVKVFRKYPFKQRELTVDFDSTTHEYVRYEDRIDSDVGVDPGVALGGE